jgi:hypothetical protein
MPTFVLIPGGWQRLRQDPAWIVKSLPTGHDIFGKAQAEFLQLVQELIGAGIEMRRSAVMRRAGK